jgi:hypothetical protein
LNFETPLRLFISYWYNKVLLSKQRERRAYPVKDQTDRAALHGLKDMAAWYAKPKPPFEPIPRPKNAQEPAPQMKEERFAS